MLRGDRATLKVQARGAPDLTYQWYRGPLLLQEETSPVIAVTNVRCDDEGSYSCVVSNEVGSVRTASAALSSYNSSSRRVTQLTGRCQRGRRLR